MTFTFDTAKKMIKHYSFLIGEDISDDFTDHKINYILIAPEDQTQFDIFIGEFNQNASNEKSLAISGFDKENVRVILVYHDTFGGNIFRYDIDKYLTKKSIEKVYLTPDF